MTTCTVLDNGVTLLTRPMPGRHGAALGFWLGSGSRHELPDESGYAHLAEHLLFDGTGLDIANACTSRELTLFHGTVPGNELAALAARFSTMLLQRQVTTATLERERRIVLQEIAEAALSPMTALQDTVLADAWDCHPLARPILGDPDSLAACTVDSIRAFIERQVCGSNLHVVASGAVHHEALVAACRPLAALPTGVRPLSRPPPSSFRAGRHHYTVDADRAHLVWLMPLPAFGNDDGVAQLAEFIISGHSDSRIHRALRDRHGLVYGIDSRLELHADCGLWWLHAHCDPQRVDTCERVMDAVFERLIVDGPDAAELAQADARLQDRCLIDDDDTNGVMERIGRESIHLGRIRSLDERRAGFTADASRLHSLLTDAWQRRLFAGFGPHRHPVSGYTGTCRLQRGVCHDSAEIPSDRYHADSGPLPRPGLGRLPVGR